MKYIHTNTKANFRYEMFSTAFNSNNSFSKFHSVPTNIDLRNSAFDSYLAEILKIIHIFSSGCQKVILAQP